jgi:thiol-disulfide isomerase/thioredoxin
MWRTCTLAVLGLFCISTCVAADEIDETLKEYRDLIAKPVRERNIDDKTSLLRIGDRIYRWAKKNAGDERSTEALLVLCEERPLGAQASGAIGLLLERAPQAPQWAELCLAIAQTGWSNADAILTQLAKESSEAVVRGAAEWGLAQRRIAEAVEIDPLVVVKVAAAQQKALQHLKSLAAISEPVRIGDEADLRELAKAKIKDMESIALGIRAPEVTGEGLNGKTITLTKFRGKVVVMIFWGAWCPICREQFPAEKELATKYADKPVALLGVNSDSEKEIAVKLAKEEGLSWPSYFDEGTTRGPIARQWAIEFWPTVILLDHRGVIRYRFKGMKKVDEAVEILLKEV